MGKKPSNPSLGWGEYLGGGEHARVRKGRDARTDL